MRGRLDTAIIRVMRDALLRRSEAEALTWADASVEPDGIGAHPPLSALSHPRNAAFERIWAAARAAGLIDNYSGHSSRTGCAHSLAERGASLVELQQARCWKSPSMPAHYARSARAGHGAVARLLEK